MKQVVLTPPVQNIVHVFNVSYTKYYGLYGGTNPEKGFITKPNFYAGIYIGRAISSLTKGNGWDFESLDLPTLIKEFIHRKFEVYEFDTAKELMKWLAE